ncbi:hypothetical protein Ancab_018535 [Ancistrocladus abbreviatus]
MELLPCKGLSAQPPLRTPSLPLCHSKEEAMATAQILTTLPGHKASINCTQWLPSSKFAFKAKQSEHHLLFSGDADGAVILWEVSLVDRKWRKAPDVPQPHKKGVMCITGIMVSLNEAIFASTSSDGTVNIWEVILPPVGGGDCKLSCLESFSVGSKPMIALSLAELPGNEGHVVLALGGLDNKIHLYSGEKAGTSNQFVLACELKGHSNWICSLDFSFPECTNGQNNSLLLVSSSQDKGIQIWRLVLHDSLDSSGGEKWIPTGNSILAYGYGGSFHLWKNVGVDFNNWQPQKVPSGHHTVVSDIPWARSGEFLLSVSHDQSLSTALGSLLELSLWGLDIILIGKAAQETVDRNGNEGLDTLETIPDAEPVAFTEPPIEDQLAWHTLWPELHKLHGHGNELFSLCCDHEGKLVASSCKIAFPAVPDSISSRNMVIGSWKAIGRLQSHSSTVTQMEFSHVDRLESFYGINLLFFPQCADEINYRLLARQEAHKRIIWSCSWNPSGRQFATGSRDRTVNIWAVENQSSVKYPVTLLQFPGSVTALSRLGLDHKINAGLLAVGM